MTIRQGNLAKEVLVNNFLMDVDNNTAESVHTPDPLEISLAGVSKSDSVIAEIAKRQRCELQKQEMQAAAKAALTQ